MQCGYSLEVFIIVNVLQATLTCLSPVHPLSHWLNTLGQTQAGWGPPSVTLPRTLPGASQLAVPVPAGEIQLQVPGLSWEWE